MEKMEKLYLKDVIVFEHKSQRQTALNQAMNFLFIAMLILVATILYSKSISRKDEIQEDLGDPISCISLNSVISSVKEKAKYSRNEIIDYLAEGQRLQRSYMIANSINCPISVILAQEILESDLGNSKLTKLTNNHGNVKCKLSHKHNLCDRKPACIQAYDKIEGSNDFYLSYSSEWQAFTKRKNVLANYNIVANTDPTRNMDYIYWIDIFHKSPYATDKQYRVKLKSIIENYGLNRLDTAISKYDRITSYSEVYTFLEKR